MEEIAINKIFTVQLRHRAVLDSFWVLSWYTIPHGDYSPFIEMPTININNALSFFILRKKPRN